METNSGLRTKVYGDMVKNTDTTYEVLKWKKNYALLLEGTPQPQHPLGQPCLVVWYGRTHPLLSRQQNIAYQKHLVSHVIISCPS